MILECEKNVSEKEERKAPSANVEWSEAYFLCAKKEKDYATLKESIKTYIYFATYFFSYHVVCPCPSDCWLRLNRAAAAVQTALWSIVWTFDLFCFSTLDRGPLWALLSTSTATCACQARVLLPYDFFVALFFILHFQGYKLFCAGHFSIALAESATGCWGESWYVAFVVVFFTSFH